MYMCMYIYIYTHNIYISIRNPTTSKTGGLLCQTFTTAYPPSTGGSSKDAAFDTAQHSVLTNGRRWLVLPMDLMPFLIVTESSASC